MGSAQRLDYNTLDVFTTDLFTGNQLGLVHIPHGVSLTQEQKQTITIEFNYSETVFLQRRGPNAPVATYDAQIFTPKSELPFAGHPTIGTAVWIFENLETDHSEITINLKAGDIKVKFNRLQGTAIAAIPHAVRIHESSVTWDRVVARQSGLAEAGTELKSSRVPVVSIVSGVNFVLVDLSTQPDLLNNVVVTKDEIGQNSDLDEGSDPGLIGNVFYCILPERGGGVIHIRQRVMVIGLEDPATGAASGALTGYLALKKGGAGQTYSFEIDQGVEMGRASKIFVDVTLDGSGKAIEKMELKGQAVEVMRGSLRVR